MSEHEYLLENYLVNHVFGTLFPFHRSQTGFGTYVLLVVNYALAKLHLIGAAGFHKGLTADQAVRIIQVLSRNFEHASAYAPTIYSLLEQSDLTKMAAMAMLIQDLAE